MQLLNYTLVTLSSLSFAVQVWGYHWHFRRIGRRPPRLHALSAVSVLAFTGQVVALWPDRPLLMTAWASIPVYCAGLGLWGWSARTAGSRRLSLAFSDDAPKALITGGPYRIVRHPFYAAYLLYWLAGGLPPAIGLLPARASWLLRSAWTRRVARSGNLWLAR